LLVEDDAGVCNATRMLLMTEGYRVTTANSACEALRHMAAHSSIDLIVSDYHLADEQTGIDVIKAARRELGSNLRAVLITGDTSSVRDLPRDEDVRFVRKPVDPDRLLSILAELVSA
jgi:DNA-binding NtrC family response regulator